MSREQQLATYHEVPGGAELLRLFGRAPSFHDAEILSLDLRRKGQSALRFHEWMMTDRVSEDGSIVLDRHAIVTFALDGVLDLQIDGSSAQKVIERTASPAA